ncbi:TonB family protein [Taibaiella koreensis]|uniref:TonB family protein n=1 Tax=Taibaiella koreensis TaxID=1268548 RepID=UPI000E59DD48|nr:TonB family protein [Taibaiella koreensis]
MLLTKKYRKYGSVATVVILLGIGAILSQTTGAQSRQSTPADKIFASVEVMPQPSVDIMDYLSKNLHYPDAARKAGIEGRVIVQFVVSATGKIKDPVIQRGIDPGCDAEVLRVVNAMPDFTPGRQGGVAMNVYYTLPVSFKLAKDGVKAPGLAADASVAPSGDKIFTSVEEMPRPSVDIMDYLLKNLKYPARAKDAGIQGRVIAQFVVTKTGKIENIVIQRGIDPDCDAEVLRVLNAMPAFEPGRQAGKAVNVYYTLPVSFRLEEDAPASNPATPGKTQEAMSSNADHELKLYPNPVSDELKFYVHPNTAGAVLVFIRDMNGRELIRKGFDLKVPAAETLLRINVKQLPAGTYILEQRFGGRKSSAKFVISR